ncbi:zeaxanthin glucosyltransferase [Pantoea rodasii]|uniref:Zeaxanthin glucosyltransferase n=1 Tax=Pantoea rodasii TaxID=1076549 RepID=A0A2M9WJ28_9GAMM|nr:glycosyltransferase [Pantoea rodasii]ORM61842.1 zeaxanthin glucosyltransferase [Pantoea rodasii]PJZ07563.1 zeaxanthin glucosyltransferase [Pantoea rodasii]
MGHFAVIAPPLYSHFQALQALSRTLMARGHHITFVQQADARQLLSDTRVGFSTVGERTHPSGSLTSVLQHLASPLSLLRVIGDIASSTDMLCHELPGRLKVLQIDGVIADQMEAAGGLVAEALNLPFVSVACALPVNREPGIPLPVMPFRYGEDEKSLHRFQASQGIYDRIMQRHGDVISHHARRFGLADRHGLHQCLSPLAQMSQLVPAFDFPRQHLPACFHAVGLLRSSPPTSRLNAPWPPLPAPVVYASLGTLQGQRFRLFMHLAQACRNQQLSLVIAHCGGLNAEQVHQLERAGAAWVTDFLDQQAALQHAQLFITHAGLNSALEALEYGTPMLALPLAFDQPGVAARIAWHGVGRRASRFSRVHQLEQHLQQLLSDDSYRLRISAIQAQLQRAGGCERAADIIEQALGQQRVVLAEAT